MKKSCGLSYLLMINVLILTCTNLSRIEKPKYSLQVKLEPQANKLTVQVWIDTPPAAIFYLHKDLAIHQVLADGKAVECVRDTLVGPLQYCAGSPMLVKSENIRQLYLEYSGEIKEIVNGVNMITPNLVELAFYSGWFPVFANMGNYTYSLQVDLPCGYVTTTNGRLVRKDERNSRVVSEWCSFQPAWDIVLISSPNLRILQGGSQNLKVEMFYTILPDDSLQVIMNDLLRGFNLFTELYGNAQIKGDLRFMYSPRSGWGYSRAPLFVVPEQWANQEIITPDGKARALHGSYHEMAHFWWMLADATKSDDWLNEGLAEYSAFRISETNAGPEFAAGLLEEYRRHAAESQTQDAIAETPGDSPDRYVNRYEKTTLMFVAMRDHFGEAALDRTLATLYLKNVGKQQLTTGLFLQQLKMDMSTEAANFCRTILYKKGWKGENLLKEEQ